MKIKSAVSLTVMMIFAVSVITSIPDVMTAESSVKNQFITEFALPSPVHSGPFAVATTPQGEVWFTEDNVSKIGVFFPNNSSFKDYTIPFYGRNLWGIAVDQERNVWFTGWDTDSIGKLNIATGNFTQFKLPGPNPDPTKILVDRKGIVWFTEWEASKIGRLDPKTGEMKEFETPTESAGPVGITLAEDGKLWFAESYGQKIAYFDPDREQFQEFKPKVEVASPVGIAIGDEGTVYFTDHGGSELIRYNPSLNDWDKIPTSPSPQDFFPISLPTGLDVDKNGNVWTAEHGGNKIGKYDPRQDIFTEYWIPNPASVTLWMAVDPDGRAWFAEAATDKIGSVNPNAVPLFSINAKTPQLTLSKLGEKAEASFEVTSSSTSPQNLLINLTSPSFPNPNFSKVTIEPKSLILPPYTSTTVKLSIIADSKTKPGNYTFNVSATDRMASQGRIIRVTVDEQSYQKTMRNQTSSSPPVTTSRSNPPPVSTNPYPLTTKLPVKPEPTATTTVPQASSTSTPDVRSQERGYNSTLLPIAVGIAAAVIGVGLILRIAKSKNKR